MGFADPARGHPVTRSWRPAVTLRCRRQLGDPGLAGDNRRRRVAAVLRAVAPGTIATWVLIRSAQSVAGTGKARGRPPGRAGRAPGGGGAGGGVPRGRAGGGG